MAVSDSSGVIVQFQMGRCLEIPHSIWQISMSSLQVEFWLPTLL